MKKFLYFFLITLIISGCAYYNTFFNAKKHYELGKQKKEESKVEKISPEIRKHFQSAIAKSWKVIDSYGDSSSWADDALLMIGRSHYQLEEYEQSRDILEQFLQKYLQSPHIPEARLWLGKAYSALEQDDKALEQFQDLLADTEEELIKAQAELNLGELYYKRQEYESALPHFKEAAKLGGRGEISGNGLFLLGEVYMALKKYEAAAESFDQVLRQDMPILKQYDALMRMVDALNQLERFDQAANRLRTILRDQRFKQYYSNIAVKLANIFEFQGEYEYAIDNYREVIQDYPRSEGAALANFYIAQIFEFEFGQMDSAKVKYDAVRKENAKIDAVQDAAERSKILAEYLKIRDQLRKDKSDIFKLEHGDSSLVDSLVTGVDTLLVTTKVARDSVNLDSLKQANADSLTTTQKVKENKVAVSRSPEAVRESLLKNTFNLAEYFLLNYQHYDSASVRYSEFVSQFQDSVLTPKAYYALYYIYNTIKNDTSRADSLKRHILTYYPNTSYGRKLSGTIVTDTPESKSKSYKDYLQAEKLLEANAYIDAIKQFRTIATEDSGSVWAEKSRYAIARIYEKHLDDTEKAIEAYTVLAQQYPKSEAGKLAMKKIAEPPKEEPKEDAGTKVKSGPKFEEKVPLKEGGENLEEE